MKSFGIDIGTTYTKLYFLFYRVGSTESMIEFQAILILFTAP
jgi:hypothetical protein